MLAPSLFLDVYWFKSSDEPNLLLTVNEPLCAFVTVFRGILRCVVNRPASSIFTPVDQLGKFMGSDRKFTCFLNNIFFIRKKLYLPALTPKY